MPSFLRDLLGVDSAPAVDRRTEILQQATKELHKENHELKLKYAALCKAAEERGIDVASVRVEGLEAAGNFSPGRAPRLSMDTEIRQLLKDKDARISTLEAQVSDLHCQLALLRARAAASPPMSPAPSTVGTTPSVPPTLSLGSTPAASPAVPRTLALGKFEAFASKMAAAGLSEASIRAFKHSYDILESGGSCMVPEWSLEPVEGLPSLASIAGRPADPALLRQTACIKLNGGLGTGMGLEQAKSLLKVKEGLTFLDFIARQVLHLRRSNGCEVKFALMNSFATAADTRAALAQYPELAADPDLELLQNKVPKVDAETLEPVAWPVAPEQEWCPPGHGDLYAALAGSGLLDRLLAQGVKYLFVSNSDNLGATLDLDILSYAASSGAPFLMEVAERTAADKKGGHLARRRADGKLVLREAAMCPKEDEAAFQDVAKHRFFNTNNLWVRLDALRAKLDACGGVLPLPTIKNSKTVDPRDKSSPKVFQLETAMGAGIESFEGARALVVPRSRFAPVKSCGDLLALRSDAYRITEDHRVELAPPRSAPPCVTLDPAHYHRIDQLEAAFGPATAPSLLRCRSLTVEGPVQLDCTSAAFEGDVQIKSTGSKLVMESRTYTDGEVLVG